MNINFRDGCKVVEGLTLAVSPLVVIMPMAITISNIALNIFQNPRSHITWTNTLAIIGFICLIREWARIANFLIFKSSCVIRGSHDASDCSLYGHKFEWLRPSCSQPTPIQRIHVRVETIYPASDIDREVHEKLKRDGHVFR